MTTLYREVAIETVEQAEALPEGAMAFRARRDETGPLVARLNRFDGESAMWTMTGEMHGYSSQHMVSWGGWMALMPLAAQEEMDTDYYTGGDGSPTHRYVTRWENT